jgi:hypothetical protein
MTNEAITLDQVAKAAEAIKGDGLEATVDRVIEQLGVGSQNSIGSLFDQWKMQDEEAADFSRLVQAEKIRAAEEGRPEYTLEQLKDLKEKFGGSII